jgi:predicted SAM-dependent methyltransferase
LQYLNLGCGNRYHPDWINIDIAPQGVGVIVHDLSQGIPLPNNVCDVVYHSHVLEHIRRSDALPFMEECYRVLKPGGIFRIAVPDLEEICRVYLKKLDAAVTGDAVSAHDYEWILLEMYDQTVREQSGGGMRMYLEQNPIPNEEFVYRRIGEEGRQIVRALRAPQANSPERIRAKCLRHLVQSFRKFLGLLRKRLLEFMLGPNDTRALEIGRFRLGGQVHHWMYDRHSLAKLILAAGFRDPTIQSATRSQIPQWLEFNLDTLDDRTVIKPDSLFMEAVKPSKQ